MNYMKYSRSLVMLEAQSTEFSAKEGAVKGHLKVETGNGKGALRCTVQNLRYYPKGEYIYKLILFGRKGERTLHTIIGNLVVNRYGNSETYFRFNPLDVDERGNSFDDYFAAIVAAVSTRDAKEALHPVLKGTLEFEGQFAGHSSGKSGRPQVRAAGAVDEATSTEVVEMGESEAAPECEEAQALHSPGKNYNQFYNEYLLNICSYTCKAADCFEEVEPFETDRTGARWKKISDVSTLPLVSPGAHYFAGQYQHFLFGAAPGEDGTARKYYFAIPGRFLQTEQPDGGRSGFTLWQPVKGAAREKNAYGYWIICVDALTGSLEDA